MAICKTCQHDLISQKNGGIQNLRLQKYQNSAFKTFWEFGDYINTKDGAWEFGQVQFDAENTADFYQIFINVYKGNTTDGYAAVDEVQFTEVFDECPTIIGGNGRTSAR